MISFRGVSKTYGQNIEAVKDFSLDIAEKEFIVLVGPSGCGKSTILRITAGLETITRGQLYFDGQPADKLAPQDRDLAMVFQNYALYPHLTIYDNMAFALKIRRTGKDVIDHKVRTTAELLEITDLLQRRPMQISGGQRQRAAIGRAIVRNPKLFLLDEPFSNLDAKLRNQMRTELIKLRRRIDTTFLYVTHDQTEAMTLGDRLVVMKDGVIQQIGTPQDVFEYPANTFVAGFIGAPQMNFLDARLVCSAGHYHARIQDTSIVLSPQASNVLSHIGQRDGEIILGIRPEHIAFAHPDDPSALSATTELLEMLGSEFHLHVRVGNVPVVIRAAATLPVTDIARKAIPGTVVRLRFPAKNLHLFDHYTQKNLLAM